MKNIKSYIKSDDIKKQVAIFNKNKKYITILEKFIDNEKRHFEIIKYKNHYYWTQENITYTLARSKSLYDLEKFIKFILE